MLTFRTSPPPHYLPPTTEEMRVAADRVGLKSFSRDLVADLCNLAAGGALNPPSAYRQVVREGAERKLPAPQEVYVNRLGKKVPGWAISVPGSTSKIGTESRQEAVDSGASEMMRYHRSVGDFLGSVDLSRFPGTSPLEQAMSLLKLLSKKTGGTGGGEAGEPLPIFQENDNPEKAAAELHDLMEQVDSLSDEEHEMLDPDGEAQTDTEADGQRTGSKGLSGLKVAEKLADPAKERLMLDISRHCLKFTKLQVRRQRKLVPDAAGAERRTRPIEALGELPRLVANAWALSGVDEDLFWLKALRGDLEVREKVTRQEKKQAVFVLLDGSGSMKDRRHWKASGVVMHFLKAAARGDCVVWLSVFDTALTKTEKAESPDEAKTLIKKFLKGNYLGGGTDIGGATKAAHAFLEKEIASGAELWRPEIVVLTDEDTSFAECTPKDVRGTTVHAFAMEVANPGLVKWAHSLGGLGLDNF